MFAHGNRIWIVITDGVNTRIGSCDDGMAIPVATPSFNFGSTSLDERDLVACKAWFKVEGLRRLSRNPRSQHVLHVSQLLLEAARERAYDGLIIIATEPAAAELNKALGPETRALLIGKVIRDRACGDPADADEFAEMRH